MGARKNLFSLTALTGISVAGFINAPAQAETPKGFTPTGVAKDGVTKRYNGQYWTVQTGVWDNIKNAVIDCTRDPSQNAGLQCFPGIGNNVRSLGDAFGISLGQQDFKQQGKSFTLSPAFFITAVKSSPADYLEAVTKDLSTDKWSPTSNLYDYNFKGYPELAARWMKIEEPINQAGDLSGNNVTSKLGKTLYPAFEGGTLTVDQSNSTYTQNFTLPQDGTIDGANKAAVFTGSFTGTGILTVTNSGTSSDSHINLGSTSNPIALGGLISSRSSINNPSTTILAGETHITGDTIVNFGVIQSGGIFSTSNLLIDPESAVLSTGPALSKFVIAPANPSQTTTVHNNLSIERNGILQAQAQENTFPSSDTAVQISAGAINASQGSTMRLQIPVVIETRNSSIIDGSIDGAHTRLSDFDDLGGFSKPITWKGAGEATFSPSSTVFLRSQTNANRPLSAPDFVVQGKIKVNTDNFTLTRYTSGGSDSPNGNLVVDTTGELSGTGTIHANVINYGTVSPGNSIGTLTIDGDYGQLSIPGSTPASLNIEVNGSTSDLLKITGDNRTVLLGGNLTIGSLANTHITPGRIYTAIDITGQNAKGGEYKLNTDLSGVVGSSGYLFARETDPAFARLDQSYYDTCTSSDPNIQKNCTKLQFAWLQVAKDPNSSNGTKQVATPTGTVAVVAPTTTQSPRTVINQVKQTGGAITTASSGNTNTNTNTCTANTGNAAACQQQNQAGTGKSGSNSNNTQVAKVIDAGQASLGVAVTNGTTGGDPVTVNGVDSGYTTNQTNEAQVTPDFVSVYNALFSIPNRQQLNQALHSITAEPYASMQSVALEALEQFRANTLALTAGRRLPFYAQEQVCKDGTTNANDPNQTNANQNSDASAPCDTVTRQKLTPWSLLIDGSNTQASLNGTNDLASLDYNIFSSSYGLQYDFNRNWSAGAAFGYGRANLYNYEYSNSRINSDTYSGAAWGIYRPTDAWKLTALAGYMNLQYDSSRNINFGGLDRNAVANWSGNGFTSALAAQYDWVLSSDKASRSAVRIKPNTFFSYALHHQGAFSETGAQSLNLALDSHTADSLIYGIGFSIESPIITGKTSRLIPKLYVGYEYDFNGDSNEEHQLSSSFAEVPALGSFDVLGQNRGANAVDVALALEFETSDTLSLYSNVGGAFWSNGNELNYGAGLRLRW